MLIETDLNVIEAWKARKRAQWDRVAGTLSGLQMIQSGERGTQFAIAISSDLVGTEQVLIGQLPHAESDWQGPPGRRRRVSVPDARKSSGKREIDLSDDDIDAVIAAWRDGLSALSRA